MMLGHFGALESSFLREEIRRTFYCTILKAAMTVRKGSYIPRAVLV